jgi:hypothetical protein
MNNNSKFVEFQDSDFDIIESVFWDLTFKIYVNNSDSSEYLIEFPSVIEGKLPIDEMGYRMMRACVDGNKTASVIVGLCVYWWLEHCANSEILKSKETPLERTFLKVLRGEVVSQEEMDAAFTSTYTRRNKKREKEIQLKLAEMLKGRVEVQTPDGYIDILTKREIIEVKCFKDWKSAVGQILIYGSHYPKREKRIHLFGEYDPKHTESIREHCNKLNIRLTWEN